MTETEKKDFIPRVIASGKRVILRDRRPSDVDTYIRWRTYGEWRKYDAPWEDAHTEKTAEETAERRKRFLMSCEEAAPTPRARAMIATKENKPLGWVNRYGNERFPQVWYVGIDICEDEYLNRGIGAEALSLWVRYLFTNTDIHRLSLDTWSFNPRMMRVAEKLGFIYEGAQREIVEWQGEPLDLVHYGMLRSEWEHWDRKRSTAALQES